MVPTLPQMATNGPHSVDALCELGMNRLQGAMHALECRRNHDQVHVVGHQAVRINRKSQPAAVRMEEIQIGFWIPGRVKHLLAVIATLRNVVRQARKDSTEGSGHCRKVNA